MYVALSQPQGVTDTRVQEVPDYLIDNISFAIMHDPVSVRHFSPLTISLLANGGMCGRKTKTGHTYDRPTLLEHLRRSATDPLTREPLRKEDLRPNLALKQACAEFLAENGWAVDY